MIIKENGTMGKGGKGGYETSNGNNRKIEFEIYTEIWFNVETNKQYHFKILLDEPSEKISAGKPGRNGYNSVRIQQPRTIKPLNPSFVVNEYKNFLRNHFVNNIQESKLCEFLMDLYENSRIRRLYDTLGLVDELQSVETEFIHSRDKVSFIPFIKSLLHRIKEFVKHHSVSIEEKIVLNYLYIATFQKLSVVQNNNSLNQISAIDLIDYLNSVRNYIDKLRRFKRDVFFISQQESKNSLDKKINATKKFIKINFIREIENITMVADNRTLSLLNKLSVMQNDERNKNQQIIEMKAEL